MSQSNLSPGDGVRLTPEPLPVGVPIPHPEPAWFSHAGSLYQSQRTGCVSGCTRSFTDRTKKKAFQLMRVLDITIPSVQIKCSTDYLKESHKTDITPS